LYLPKIFPVWKRLYNRHWFGSEVPLRSFEIRKEYDILLRASALPIGEGKPAWHYQNLWDHAESVVAKRKAEAISKKANALESEIAVVRQWNTTWLAPPAPPPQPSPPHPLDPTKEIHLPKRPLLAKAFGGRKKQSRRFATSVAAPTTPPSHARQPRRLWGTVETSSFEERDPIGLFPELAMTENDSATPGTFQEDADPEPATEASTSAPSAAPAPTALPLARPRPPRPVTTPLRLDRWRFHLGRFDLTNEYADVLHGIEFGFSYRSSLSNSETRIYPNMRSASEFPEVINQKYKKSSKLAATKVPILRPNSNP
jgi:hypothetical protein